MVLAYLALGSNIGDKAGHLREAAQALVDTPGVSLRAASPVFRTPPWGDVAQDWFANAVLGVQTSLTPEALLESALEIERAMGRIRARRWGPRLIDIDVLLHGEAQRAEPRLTLPHPAMLERAFVLVPLQVIAPGLTLAGAPIEAHLSCLDTTGIEPLGPLLDEKAPAA